MSASRLIYSICESAGTEGYSYTMGGSYGTDPEDSVHAELIIMWGINAVSTNMHQVTIAERARKDGAKIIVIDVHSTHSRVVTVYSYFTSRTLGFVVVSV